MTEDRLPPPDRRVVRADASWANAILPLLQAAFPRWPAPEIEVSPFDHLQWKMTGAPGAPDHPHTVVLEGDRIVAVQLRWLAHAHVGGAVMPFDRGVDLAVDPERQGTGLARFIFDDDPLRNPPLGDFVRWDTPSNDARVPHLEAQHLAGRRLRVWVRTFDVRTFAATHRQGGRKHLAVTAASALRRKLSKLPRANSAAPIPRTQVSDLTAFDARTDALWEAVAPQFDIARVRDAELMNWRYFDPRAGRASALAAFEGNTLVGYTVYKRRASEGAILELVAHPRHRGAAGVLLRAACDRLRAAGASRVRCWLPPGHPSEAALPAVGFRDAGHPQQLIIDYGWMLGATEAVAVVRDPSSKLHITMGDLDFV
ncbi:MAG: GNAT family N-acetyltransferase [Chloroflexi bacterium]|nr:GNAT family N-acetyltransferase [Chloroflexota bacterium]MDA1147036.1 GNAT family N-acetyltransferase [Chloroflexota bacterium]